MAVSAAGFGDGAAKGIVLIAGLGARMIRWTGPFRGERVARSTPLERAGAAAAGRSAP
jgi:hypothetical protein